MTNVSIRKGMPSADLTKEEFRARFFQRFAHPAFDAVRPELERVVETAWDGYRQHRKAPRTQPAGSEFADPAYELSLDWLKGRDAVQDAAARHANTALPSRILLINASPRSEHTCPGEMSKTCLMPAGKAALLDRYVGYYRPYSANHADLDEETALFEEVRNAARALIEAVARYRAGERPAGATLHEPRPK